MAIEPARKRSIRLPVGLLLSIGAEKPERGPGRAIDHFRAKPGQAEQFAREAVAFHAHYGDDPKEISDVYFLSDDVPAVLDVRLLAFSQSGIRGVGDTNFAEITDEAEFEDRVFGAHAFEDGFTFFPKDVTEIRPELREAWEGEPIRGELTGRSDARVDKLQVKVVTSLEFCLPEIMGLGKVARISTSGRNSTRNLYKGMWTQAVAFGRLTGVQFRLALRSRPTQRFDAKEKKFVSTTIYELVIDTPYTIAELTSALEEHRKTFGAPTAERLRIEGRAMKNALALPAPDMAEQTREEVTAEVPDWLLNQIAHIEAEIPDEARKAMLLGVFGVEDASALDPEQAERYWRMLEAASPAEPVEGEVVNGSGDDHAESAGADLTAGSSEGPLSAADEPAPAEPSSEAGSSPAADGAEGSSGSGEPELEPPASEPLPGEPVEGLMDPIDVAGDLVIPIGSHRGKTRIADVDETWLEWALRNGGHFAGTHATFYSGLELWVRNRKPDLWERVRG